MSAGGWWGIRSRTVCTRLLGAPQGDPLRLLWRELRRQRGASGWALALAALSGVAAVAEVLLARSLVKHGVAAGRLAWLMVAVAAGLILSVMAAMAVAGVARRVEGEILVSLVRRVGRLGEMFARTRPAGDLAERAWGLRIVREAVELAGFGATQMVVAALGCAGMIAVAPGCWPAVVVLAALAALTPWGMVVVLREADLRVRSFGGVLAQLLTDTLAAPAAVRAHRAGPVLAGWQRPLLDRWAATWRSLSVRAAWVSGAVSGGCLALIVVSVVLAAGSGGRSGSLVVLALGLMVWGSVSEMSFAARRLVALRSVLARIFDALRAPLIDPEPVAAARTDRGGVDVRIDHGEVVLAGSTVLAGIDLRIAAGEHVAVLGSSGAGKSTLIAVLGGWLPLAAGSITVGGEPLEGAHLATLRARIAWSDPIARLKNRTPIENALAGSEPGAPSARERLRTVGLAVDESAPIGEDGRRLPPGGRERLRLARALGRPSASLVLLDEALRGLPPADRGALLAHARQVWQHATLLHVTHDPHEALSFDRVVVIDGGRITHNTIDPGRDAAIPGNPLHALLESHRQVQQRIAGLTGSRRDTPAVANSTPGETDRSEPPRLAVGTILAAAAGSAAASLVATAALVTAVALINRHVPHLGGRPALFAVVLMLGAATAGSLAALADRAASGRVGAHLRRRALWHAAHPTTDGTEGLGEQLGRVLELDTVERAAQGIPALVLAGAAQLIAATIALTLAITPAAAAVILLALAAGLALARRCERVTRDTSRHRRALAATLLDRLLGHRAVTIYHEQHQDEAIGLLAHSQRRHDHSRALLLAVPHAAAVILLALLALAHPHSPARATEALGGILLALIALQQITLALADTATAAAAWRDAKPLLAGHPPGPPAPADPGRREAHSPAPGTDALYHQPLIDNAMLAICRWPPTPEHERALRRHIPALALDQVIEQMPNGLAQPLGQTGWQLSQGEQARFSLLRALATNPTHLTLHGTLDALDPHTAHCVLDHLENLPTHISQAADQSA